MKKKFLQKLKELMLKIKSVSLSNKLGKEINLNEKVFGIVPREDIVTRVIRWQLAKRRLGNHSVQTRSQVKMTTAKMYKQKGTGKARHGSGSVSQFRGGGMAHGPVVHSHAHRLNKKVRKLALAQTLSKKNLDKNLHILADVKKEIKKTKEFNKFLIKNKNAVLDTTLKRISFL